jgi:hypothetical protein
MMVVDDLDSVLVDHHTDTGSAAPIKKKGFVISTD